MKINILSTARTPTYGGTTREEWMRPSFEDYGFDVGSVADLSDAQRAQIADGSLLGDPDAETFDELSFFPVVTPGGDLNENALRAVIGGRGSQADIPTETLESAQAVARRLLEDEFGMGDEEDEMETNILRKFLKALGIGKQDMLHAVAGNQEGEGDNNQEVNMEVQELLALSKQHGVGLSENEVSALPVGIVQKLAAFIEALAKQQPAAPEVEPPATNCAKLEAAVNEVGGPEKAHAILTNAKQEREAARAALVETVTANTSLTAEDLAEMSDTVLTNIANLVSVKTNAERTPDYSGRDTSKPKVADAGVHKYEKPEVK